MKQIHWTELRGNKYLKKLEPAMLTTAGCLSLQKIKEIGKKRNDPREWIEVLYDRDYVVSRLAIDVLRPLNLKTPEQLISFVLDAWKHEHKDDQFKCIAISRKIAEDCKIDLTNIKQYKLHGKPVYVINDIKNTLAEQGMEIVDEKK